MAKESGFWDLDTEEVPQVDRVIDPQEQDAYWQQAHSGEAYFRDGLTYEDYAPAYCVGYVGYAQYGGKFEDAEKSLQSNWVRLKGDSQLTLEDATFAMKAAWNRVAARHG